jgi:hypothetical protein
MTSKSNQPPAKIDCAKLLRHYTRVKEVMEKPRAINRSPGLSEEFMHHYVQTNKKPREKEYEKFLDAVCVANTIPETGSHANTVPDIRQFNSMQTLKIAKLIPNKPTPLNNVEYPRRELIQFHRIKTYSGQDS